MPLKTHVPGVRSGAKWIRYWSGVGSPQDCQGSGIKLATDNSITSMLLTPGGSFHFPQLSANGEDALNCGMFAFEQRNTGKHIYFIATLFSYRQSSGSPKVHVNLLIFDSIFREIPFRFTTYSKINLKIDVNLKIVYIKFNFWNS